MGQSAFLKKTSRNEDSEMIRQAKERPEMFKPLYLKYYEQIFRFILARTNDKQASADICSEVFYSAMKKIQNYEDRGFPFSSWLYRMAINESYDYFKNAAKKRYVLIEGPVENQLFEEIEFTTPDNNQHILKTALRTLKEKELSIIELRFFEKKSFKEIGYFFNITENNAKVRTYRVLDKLKTTISSLRNEK